MKSYNKLVIYVLLIITTSFLISCTSSPIEPDKTFFEELYNQRQQYMKEGNVEKYQSLTTNLRQDVFAKSSELLIKQYNDEKRPDLSAFELVDFSLDEQQAKLVYEKKESSDPEFHIQFQRITNEYVLEDNTWKIRKSEKQYRSSSYKENPY